MFQEVGCARNRLQFRTVQQNLKIISLDTVLRVDGILALVVLGNTTHVVCPHTNHGRKQSRRVVNDLDNVDLVPSNVQSSNQALLHVFEHNEAVVKMIIKCKNPQSCS